MTAIWGSELDMSLCGGNNSTDLTAAHAAHAAAELEATGRYSIKTALAASTPGTASNTATATGVSPLPPSMVHARSTSSNQGAPAAATVLQLPRTLLQHQLALEQRLMAAVNLRHPQVLQIHEVIRTEHYLHLVLDDCSDTMSLQQYIQQQQQQQGTGCGGLSEPYARWLLQQLVLAVHYCHSKGLVGLDLQHTLLQEVPGLPHPIIKIPCALQNWPGSSGSSSSTADAILSDVKACGDLLLAMLGGSIQQGSSNSSNATAAAAAAAAAALPTVVLPSSCSPMCADLLSQILTPRPMRAIVSTFGIMKHPWFAKDLPAGALDLNSRYSVMPRLCQQSDEELRGFVSEMLALPPGLVVYQQLGDLPTGLMVKQQQLPLGVMDCEVYEAQQQQQQQGGCESLWVCSLPGHAARAPTKSQQQCRPGAATLDSSSEQQQQQQREVAVPAAEHPALLLAQQQYALTARSPSAEFMAALQQLLPGTASSSSSSSAQGMLSAVRGVCLQPPLLLLEAPPQHTLAAWLHSQQQEAGVAAAGSSGTCWADSVPSASLLQLLCIVAAALAAMHNTQPPLIHGDLHAGAVNLLLPLGSQPGGSRDDAWQQQQQQQQPVVELAQLSLLGPWQQDVSPRRTVHPLFSAPELLLNGAAASAATDVYSFGMLMWQLASGWVSVEQLQNLSRGRGQGPTAAAGGYERLGELNWCFDVLQQYGTTFPGVLMETDGSGSSTMDSFYPGLRIPEQLRQLLPQGYWQLMCNCCSTDAQQRPSMQQVLKCLQDMCSSNAATAAAAADYYYSGPPTPRQIAAATGDADMAADEGATAAEAEAEAAAVEVPAGRAGSFSVKDPPAHLLAAFPPSMTLLWDKYSFKTGALQLVSSDGNPPSFTIPCPSTADISEGVVRRDASVCSSSFMSTLPSVASTAIAAAAAAAAAAGQLGSSSYDISEDDVLRDASMCSSSFTSTYPSSEDLSFREAAAHKPQHPYMPDIAEEGPEPEFGTSIDLDSREAGSPAAAAAAAVPSGRGGSNDDYPPPRGL